MENEWSDQTVDGEAYVGCERKNKLIYVGGPYYCDSSQIHLTVKQAREVRKLLGEAIRRCATQKKKSKRVSKAKAV